MLPCKQIRWYNSFTDHQISLVQYHIIITFQVLEFISIHSNWHAVYMNTAKATSYI